jgi:hypothetical protein
VKRFALVAALVVATAELSAIGCNAILGNDPGTLLQEASTSESSCPAGEKSCGACVDITDPKVGCGGACSACTSPQNGQAACVLENDVQTCGLGSCNAQFGNCDNDPSNGCETHTTTKENCGSCGADCKPLPYCEPNLSGDGGYVCSATCDSPNITCDGGDAGTECVDPNNDNSNCGECNHSCTVTNGTGSCMNGACTVQCDLGDVPCGTNQSCIASSNTACGPSCTDCTSVGDVCDLSTDKCVSNGPADSGSHTCTNGGCGYPVCALCGIGASCDGTGNCVCTSGGQQLCTQAGNPPNDWCCGIDQNCAGVNQCTNKTVTCTSPLCQLSAEGCGCNNDAGMCATPTRYACGAGCSPCSLTQCCCPVGDGGGGTGQQYMCETVGSVDAGDGGDAGGGACGGGCH